MDTGNYKLVNTSDKVSGGPFTRVDPGDPNDDTKKSVLDLCIVSKELNNYVKSLIIDRDRKFTPHLAVNSNELIYTDHFSLLLTLNRLPLLGKQKFRGENHSVGYE